MNQITCNKNPNLRCLEKLTLGLAIALCLAMITVVCLLVALAYKDENTIHLDSNDIICVNMSVYKNDATSIIDDDELDNKTS